MQNQIVTETMTLEREEGRIVYGKTHQGAYMTKESEIANIKGAQELSGHPQPYVLFDIQGSKGISKEARKMISKTDGIGGAALVVGGGISRIIGNFMMGMNRIAVPIKLFKTKEDGLEWLRSLEKDES